MILDELASERFFAKINFSAIWEGCWHWTASKSPRGYGQFGLNGKVRRAHRISYTNFIGSIPSDKEIDHLCKNTSCVNPLHLEAVKHTENVRRGDVRLINISKTQCPKGHPYDDKNTGIGKKGVRRTCRACNRDRMREYRSQGLYLGGVFYETKWDRQRDDK